MYSQHVNIIPGLDTEKRRRNVAAITPGIKDATVRKANKALLY